jgi:hypothetical protein
MTVAPSVIARKWPLQSAVFLALGAGSTLLRWLGQARRSGIDGHRPGCCTLCCCTASFYLHTDSRLRRQLPDCLTACADRSQRGLLVHTWSVDPQQSTRVGLVAALSCCTGLSCFVGGPMPRSTVGLLVAVGTAVSVLAGLAPNDVALTVIALVAGVVSGLATYLSMPSKKRSRFPQRAEEISTPSQIEIKKNLRHTARYGMHTERYVCASR